MNGWDDLRHGNREESDHGDGGPNECLEARLQQAEQALTGELGRNAFGLPVRDRDGDCVPRAGACSKPERVRGRSPFSSP